MPQTYSNQKSVYEWEMILENHHPELFFPQVVPGLIKDSCIQNSPSTSQKKTKQNKRNEETLEETGGSLPIVTSLVRNAAAAVAPGPSGPINGRRPRTSRGWHGHGGWHGWHMVSICEYHLSESIRIYPLSSQKQCDSPTKPADSPPAEQLSSNSKWQQDINS